MVLIKIGLVGGAKYHGWAFTCIINGCDEKRVESTKLWNPKVRVEGAKIVKVWDSNKENAQRLVDLCYVDEVCFTPEEVAENVDALIIPDEPPYPSKHPKIAFSLLEKKVPMFIDKPLSYDIAEAERIIRKAKDINVPIMSCSALRFSRELEEAKEEIESIKPILTASAYGPKDLVSYGIHPLELCYTVMEGGVESVYNVGKKDRNIVRIAYKDGRTIVLQVFNEGFNVFHLDLYGKKGWKSIVVNDFAYFYYNMLKHFLWMVKEKKCPIPLEETLEIVKVIISAKTSLEKGKEIYL